MDKNKLEILKHLAELPVPAKEKFEGMSVPEIYRALETTDKVEFEKFKKKINREGWIG